MLKEIAVNNSFFNGSNLFLSFILVVNLFFIYGWMRSHAFNHLKENPKGANAIRAFILSLGGLGVFVTMFFVFEIVEATPEGRDKSNVLPSIIFSAVVFVFSLATFLFTIQRKKKAA